MQWVGAGCLGPAVMGAYLCPLHIDSLEVAQGQVRLQHLPANCNGSGMQSRICVFAILDHNYSFHVVLSCTSRFYRVSRFWCFFRNFSSMIFRARNVILGKSKRRTASAHVLGGRDRMTNLMRLMKSEAVLLYDCVMVLILMERGYPYDLFLIRGWEYSSMLGH